MNVIHLSQGTKIKTRRDRVIVYTVNLVCRSCKVGTLVPTGGVNKTKGTSQYVHKCNRCGELEWITGQIYPLVEYDRPLINKICQWIRDRFVLAAII